MDWNYHLNGCGAIFDYMDRFVKRSAEGRSSNFIALRTKNNGEMERSQ
jgi:hypothetical protein